MDTSALSGQHERTIIVFTPDNGAPFGDAMWEGDDKEAALAAAQPASRCVECRYRGRAARGKGASLGVGRRAAVART